MKQKVHRGDKNADQQNFKYKLPRKYIIKRNGLSKRYLNA